MASEQHGLEPADRAKFEIVRDRTADTMAQTLARELAPGLYIVATPIGSLADITLRAIAVLAQADVVYAEDTRHSGALLSHYGIRAKLRPYHEHNAEAERPRILEALQAGKRLALISDAGTPLVSDPGFKLVRACLDDGYPVISVPGPSAVLCALTSSGLPTDSFLFAGFLPAKSTQRKKRAVELAELDATLVLFEAPSRLASALGDLAEAFGDRPSVVARELTKLHEEVRQGTLFELSAHYREAGVKGECVIVIGPADGKARELSDDDIIERLKGALEGSSLRDASRLLADELGIAKSRIYELGLRIKD